MPELTSTILLFYKYVELKDTQAIMLWQKYLCESLNLTGRIIIANEGINATLEGDKKDIWKYRKELEKHPSMQEIHYKVSQGTGVAFPKLSIKIRSEIVSSHLGVKDIDPNKTTGKYITAEELHNWFEQKREFYIVDMRNDYEQQVGYFENSILPGMQNFRDLPIVLKKLDHLKNKTIVTVCTGGVRCEKASGFLVDNGFQDVYQLYGGIVTYMEKYPNQDFLGKLYVFDQRIVMGFNTEDPNHQIVGRCAKCGNKSENYVNCDDKLCHKHFICCSDCLDESGVAYCNQDCKVNSHKEKEMVTTTKHESFPKLLN
jgi:UPF0176 protein